MLPALWQQGKFGCFAGKNIGHPSLEGVGKGVFITIVPLIQELVSFTEKKTVPTTP